MEKRIYLDNCATTPVHPSVIAAMNEAFLHFGNPSSQHKEGRKARALCEEARQKVARLLAVPAASVMFTSGGTESNHTALTGLAALCEERGLPKHIVTTPTILNVRAVGIPSDLLMQALDLEGIAVSTGAACSSGKIKSSSVLRALSFSEQEASESVRFSLSFETTDEEIDQTIKTIERVTKPFRVSPPKQV
jgi:cysteine desulfurase